MDLFTFTHVCIDAKRVNNEALLTSAVSVIAFASRVASLFGFEMPDADKIMKHQAVRPDRAGGIITCFPFNNGSFLLLVRTFPSYGSVQIDCMGHGVDRVGLFDVVRSFYETDIVFLNMVRRAL